MSLVIGESSYVHDMLIAHGEKVLMNVLEMPKAMQVEVYHQLLCLTFRTER